LEKVAAAVKLKQGMDFAQDTLDWDEFLAIAPQSDDADEYVAKYPLYIPFKDQLFGISEADTRYADTFEGSHYKEIQRQTDSASVDTGLGASITLSTRYIHINRQLPIIAVCNACRIYVVVDK